ncbi:hypothetical protein E6W39_31560 [Kitasatospora acidiphila]|uniref:Uncharacterized protein n=1 Tax=Kitasatospora acidiphila TaxID=2567942 RepID=A0A540WAK7_9ACTN|nr:hypothetical protein [Kitasatospora acidiphila]TQF05937.1 hypothetical protein E6W39_31560 [Kitasatospora acidiphila]
MLRTPRSRTRLVALAAACATLSIGAALAAPATASAAPPNVKVSCEASGQIHFNPGVKLFTSDQDVSYQGQEGQCNDFSKFDIRSAKLTASFIGVPLGCVTSPGSGAGKGSGAIEWTDKSGETDRSILNLQIDGSSLNTGHLSGVVSKGRFKGHSFTATLKTSLLGGAAACTVGLPAGGLKDADFKGDFSIE